MNNSGTSTGFEHMASALALQCSTNLAMRTHTLGKGQFVEFILTREWTKATINKQHKNAILCTAYYLHNICTHRQPTNFSAMKVANICKSLQSKLMSLKKTKSFHRLDLSGSTGPGEAAAPLRTPR